MKLKELLVEVTDTEIFSHGEQPEDIDTSVSVSVSNGKISVDIDVDIDVDWSNGGDGIEFKIKKISPKGLSVAASKLSIDKDELSDLVSNLVFDKVESVSSFEKNYDLSI